MKLISWNVNGVRAASKKGLLELVWREQPEILCLQETKAHRDQVEPSLQVLGTPRGDYESHWSSAIKKGYSGVATYILKSEQRWLPKSVRTGIGIDAYEQEGRIVITDHEKFLLYNIYFPNGGSGLDRHQFKQKFLFDLQEHLRPLTGRPIIITGDYNVAHRDIDIFDPVKNADQSGFLPEERRWFDGFLQMGFVDTFRLLHPEARDKYTWWSYYERGRIGNRGWRIDYFCVSKELAPSVRRAEILMEVEASDHCPVLLELNL